MRIAGCPLPAFLSNVDAGTCAGKTSLRDSESCAVRCNSTVSVPSAGAAQNYTYSCNDPTGSGELTAPTYKCINSMCTANCGLYLSYALSHARTRTHIRTRGCAPSTFTHTRTHMHVRVDARLAHASTHPPTQAPVDVR